MALTDISKEASKKQDKQYIYTFTSLINCGLHADGSPGMGVHLYQPNILQIYRSPNIYIVNSGESLTN